ncbi:MAG: hypothetical protein HETSPECPRED_005232 [Heterodermia speciosa]|uniref:Methyltransferase domain-containing protein n=1 Tax=Heterodermia speciosa TaxID=116794 RepID=A0A8H3FG59_9LECA|nr:MAG: hypothetical protein HETSPECPRED_005232 [Heterodermia speciosa]
MAVLEDPLIDNNPILQSYYASFESRVGYYLFLGGTRHFGYYASGTYWPFPINGALRKMEDRLFAALELRPGAKVLDAGCGAGHVAVHLARKGLRICAIDVVSHHVQSAKEEIRRNGLENMASARVMDYHHLESLADESFDGVYTMETIVHATNPEKVLGNFFRVLKPGGRIAMHEYDHLDSSHSQNSPPAVIRSMQEVNKRTSMPGYEMFSRGVLPSMLEEQGFEDVILDDLTENVRPMARLFFIVAYIPYLIICFFGLQAYFANTQAGVEVYRYLKAGLCRYTVVTATKPSNSTSKRRRAVSKDL